MLLEYYYQIDWFRDRCSDGVGYHSCSSTTCIFLITALIDALIGYFSDKSIKCVQVHSGAYKPLEKTRIYLYLKRK